MKYLLMERRMIEGKAPNLEFLCTCDSLKNGETYAEEHLRKAEPGTTVHIFKHLKQATKGGIVWSTEKPSKRLPGNKKENLLWANRRWIKADKDILRQRMSQDVIDLPSIAEDFMRTIKAVQVKWSKMQNEPK